MSTREELSKRAFEALANGDDAAIAAIKAEIAAKRVRYNNDRDSEVTNIVARVIRGEAVWADVLPQLTMLIDEEVEYGSAAEVSLTAELTGERERGTRLVAELEDKLTVERERGASRAAELQSRLSAELTRGASLAAELAKRPTAPAPEEPAQEPTVVSRS